MPTLNSPLKLVLCGSKPHKNLFFPGLPPLPSLPFTTHVMHTDNQPLWPVSLRHPCHCTSVNPMAQYFKLTAALTHCMLVTWQAQEIRHVAQHDQLPQTLAQRRYLPCCSLSGNDCSEKMHTICHSFDNIGKRFIDQLTRGSSCQSRARLIHLKHVRRHNSSFTQGL